MQDHRNEAVYPIEVLQAQQENQELQTLAQWEGVTGPIPPEIQALRRKHAHKRQAQGQAQGYASEANYPPEVKL